MQCILKNPDVGAVLDTGAQRSAAKHTHTSHQMKAAFWAAPCNERHLDGLLHRGHPVNWMSVNQLSTVLVVVLAVVFPIYLCLFRRRGEASTCENV